MMKPEFMPGNFKPFLQRWLINTLAVLVAANVVKGIHYDTITGLLVASLLLGILNAILRPVLLLLSLPLLIVTLGLFTLVINALLLSFVGWLVGPFHVDSFSAAFWGGLVISFVSIVLNSLLGLGGARIEVKRGTKPTSRPNDDGSGPIIDV
jgi:putative membrane protein